MAKKSQRHRVRYEKGHPGCMWGLISIFDFRQGRSTQKFLSDRRHGSSRHAAGAKVSWSKHKLPHDFDEETSANDNVDGSKILKVDIGKTSVKKLMEDEMSSEQQTKKQLHGVMAKQSDHEGHCGKNQRHTKSTSKVDCNIDAYDSTASEHLKCKELNSSPKSRENISHLDLAALMEDFCSQIHQRQEINVHGESDGASCGMGTAANSAKHSQLREIDKELVQKHCILQEKLSEAAAAFLNEQFIDTKEISREVAFNQSKQLIDALEILNLNRELLFELLDDSSSLLVKHIEELRDRQLGKVKPKKSLEGANLAEEETAASRQVKEVINDKQVQKHNSHNFFRRKVRSESRNPSKGSDVIQGTNRIVILKPSSAAIKDSITATGSSSSHKLHNNDQGQSGRFNTQFSITEIKNRLKHAMKEGKKERNWISMDGLLHKIPYKRQESGVNTGKEMVTEVAIRDLSSKAHKHKERIIKPIKNSKREDKIVLPKHCHRSTDKEVASTSADGCISMKGAECSLNKESNIYLEAKKHLAEMLSNGNENGALSNGENARSLGRILSLPDYNLSPVFSPGKETDRDLINAKMRFFPNKNLGMFGERILSPKRDNNASQSSPARQNLHIPPDSTDEYKPETNQKEPDLKSNPSEDLLPGSRMKENIHPSSANLISDGDIEITEVPEPICLEERNLLNGLSESNGTTITTTGPPENLEKEEFSNCLRQDLPAEDEPLQSSLDSSPSSPSINQKVEAQDSINEMPERPSPVSVLEPLFVEDIDSPRSTISQPGNLPVQPLQIQFESEASILMVHHSDRQSYPSPCAEEENIIFEYVTAVLEISEVNWDEFLRKYQSSDHPVDPSVFNEVEILFGEPCGDRKILFDCVNEVLSEIHDRYFGCSPLLAFAACGIRPLLEGKNILHEVWEGVNWHLLPQTLPHTLEQIVGKDMEKSRTWLDLRLDTEAIGIEMAEGILHELIEDAILELCS